MNNAIATTSNEFIKSTLIQVASNLDDESINGINHYLDNAEYEMAFEGLFIEIMNFQTRPNIDLTKSLEVAYSLKLDEHTTFDIDFWKKFTSYIAS